MTTKELVAQLVAEYQLAPVERLRLEATAERLARMDFVDLEGMAPLLREQHGGAYAALATAMLDARVAAATPPGPAPEAFEAANARWREQDTALREKRAELLRRASNQDLSAAQREEAQLQLQALPREAVYTPPNAPPPRDSAGLPSLGRLFTGE